MHFFSLNVNIEFISLFLPYYACFLCMFFMQVFLINPSYLSLFVSFAQSCVTGYTKSV